MSDGALHDKDWEGIDSLYDAFQMLWRKGRLSVDLWRRLHCMRCREIWEYMADSRSRIAVETAERFLEKTATPDELQHAFECAVHAANEVWDNLWELRISDDPGAILWPVSQEVDDTWIRFCAASAAKSCAENSEVKILFTSIPDIDVRAWREARPEILERLRGEKIDGEQLRKLVLQRWEELGHEEEQRLVVKLRELVEAEVGVI